MPFQPMKLVTIITEGILAKKICDKCLTLGATGFTSYEVHGSGSRSVRSDSLPGSNMRIEVACPEEVAQRIVEYMAQAFFKNYACILWVSDVGVLGGNDYVKSAS